jgi:hypothetical protein
MWFRKAMGRTTTIRMQEKNMTTSKDQDFNSTG